MQLIRQISGEVEEHLIRRIETKTFWGVYKWKILPELNPWIDLILSDKKTTYGTFRFFPSEWESTKQQSTIIPIFIGKSHKPGTEEEHFLYMYKGLYYLTEIYMDSDDVLIALKNSWEGKKEKLSRELDRIKAKVEYEGSARQPIPEDVQIIVWNRDGGRCVKCGSVQNLEFDHIIPLSKGGNNTARNIQLLCESCNRSKGAKIGG